MSDARKVALARSSACLAVLVLILAACGSGTSAGPSATSRTSDACSSLSRGKAAETLLPGLFAVSAAAGTDQAWALGQHRANAGCGFTYYLVHFSGLAWTEVAAFPPEDRLSGVSAISGRKAWIWGSYQRGTDWNAPPILDVVSGNTVRQANPPMLSHVYGWGFAASGPENALFAGGARSRRGRFLGVRVAGWDGGSWHSLPTPPSVSGPLSLSTSGSSDSWMATMTAGKSRVFHWDGTSWSASYAPPAALYRPNSAPARMSVASTPGRAWVVYNQESTVDPENGPGPPPRPFSAYFDGLRWRAVAVPSSFSTLSAVTLAGGDAWAFGQLKTNFPAIAYSHLGTAWRLQRLPPPQYKGCNPAEPGISAASPTYVVAVGCLAFVNNGRLWQRVDPRPSRWSGS